MRCRKAASDPLLISNVVIIDEQNDDEMPSSLEGTSSLHPLHASRFKPPTGIHGDAITRICSKEQLFFVDSRSVRALPLVAPTRASVTAIARGKARSDYVISGRREMVAHKRWSKLVARAVVRHAVVWISNALDSTAEMRKNIRVMNEIVTACVSERGQRSFCRARASTLLTSNVLPSSLLSAW